MLLALGLFVVTGSPPFGLFLSEFTILRAAIVAGHPWIAAVMLLAGRHIHGNGGADPGDDARRAAARRWRGPRERLAAFGPVALAPAVLMLGVYIPAPLRGALESAAATLGGTAP